MKVFKGSATMLSYVLICFRFVEAENVMFRCIYVWTISGGVFRLMWCSLTCNTICFVKPGYFFFVDYDCMMIRVFISSHHISIHCIWCLVSFILFLIFWKKIPQKITISISSVKSLVFSLPFYHSFHIRIVVPWKYTFPLRYRCNDLKCFDHRRHDYIVWFIDVECVDIWGYHFAL